MAKKKSRPIRNWGEYNRSLIKRGNVTVWFSEEAIQKWYHTETKKKRGRPKVYSAHAILCALVIRSVFRLSLRAAQGFIESVIALMGLDLKCPSYTTFCRRAATLKVPMAKVPDHVVDIVFDSSGVKFYGPGEWQRRKHGISKRRKWRKVHIALDPESQQVMVAGFSEQGMHDSQALPPMLEAYPGDIDRVLGDGAYDTVDCYEGVYSKGGRPIIPPRKGARLQKGENPALVPRDKYIDRITRQKRGKKRWKKEVGYHQRSLVETTFSRLKGIMGDRFNSKLFRNQATEMFTRLMALKVVLHKSIRAVLFSSTRLKS